VRDTARTRRSLRAYGRLGAFCLLAIFLRPAPAGAQLVADTERRLLAERAGALRGVDSRFWAGLSFLRQEEDRQRSLKADISFGLTGDEAGERSLFKLNTGITLSRGVFPSEVTVVSKLGLQQRDGQLQEDVTTLLISYDYHTTGHVEYFAFAERFTDSFLSIQQRYEVGFGLRFGRHFGHVPGWARTRRILDEFEASLPSARQAVSTLSEEARRELPALGPGATDGLPRAKERLEHALRDRAARLFLGFVASAFAELERAEIDVVSAPAAGSSEPAATIKVPVPATQRYRLSLRPSIVVRPTDEIEIVVHPYFKVPLDGSQRVTMPDGSRRLDYRRDVISAMEWTIKEEQTGLESVGFVLNVNHYFDNTPPSVPASVIANAAALGRTLDRTSAERTHRLVSLALKLKW
jgi:hypothetical protein